MKKEKLNLLELPDHLPVLIISLVSGCLFIGLMTLLVGKTGAGVVLLDSDTKLFPYPFTIQNLMHLLFFVGLGEIYIRWRVALSPTFAI